MGRYPRISDAALPARLLQSRARERSEVLAPLRLETLSRVVDLQSAAGFLSEGLWELKPELELLCVEPSEPHRQRLPERFSAISDELDNLCSIDTSSCDAVIGLAAFHHCRSIPGAVAEAFRVLRPGGQLSACDVERDSAEAHWLEQVVGTSPQGHNGTYLAPAEMPQLLETSGFVEVSEERRSVPWCFQSSQEMTRFLRAFFALPLDEAEIAELASKVLGTRRTEAGIELSWSLNYWTAVKPDGTL